MFITGTWLFQRLKKVLTFMATAITANYLIAMMTLAQLTSSQLQLNQGCKTSNHSASCCSQTGKGVSPTTNGPQYWREPS